MEKNKADRCEDGPRKKAKYLHDADNEALNLGRSRTYSQNTGFTAGTSDSNSSGEANVRDANHSSAFVTPRQPGNHQHRHSISTTQSMPPPQPDTTVFNGGNGGSPMGSQFNSHQASPMQAIVPTNPAPPSTVNAQPPFASQFLDTGDPGLFNFDLPSMNFGNHYGALEFGMLGHMSSSGVNDPTLNALQSPLPGSINFGQQGFEPDQHFQDMQLPSNLNPIPDVSNWGPSQAGQGSLVPTLDPTTTSLDEQWQRNNPMVPHAYAIASGRGSFSAPSPASGTDPINVETPVNRRQSDYAPPVQRRSSNTQTVQRLAKTQQSQPDGPPPLRATEPIEAISKKLPTSMRAQSTFSRSRLRDPSLIYSKVTQPYPYTIAFHRMYEMLKRRFDGRKRVRIAQALASIRPSFISLNRTLTREDLVFMEKCFQRGLWDYEDFASSCGTPTIICRRTGEIAHAVKEFSLLSQWPKDVLLGRQPNLNTNTVGPDAGGGASGTATNSSSRGGHNTPKNGLAEQPPNEPETPTVTQELPVKQQPIFLAELMDDDSVVKFYEDYSRLAFADSKGYAWSPCKLLKYRARSDCSGSSSSSTNSSPDAAQEHRQQNRRTGSKARPTAAANGKTGANGRPVISPEKAMNRLGERDGFVNCMYCWYVKRDVFNIPSMIVLNVSTLSFPPPGLEVLTIGGALTQDHSSCRYCERYSTWFVLGKHSRRTIFLSPQAPLPLHTGATSA